MGGKKIIIGSRRSRLALVQAELVGNLLKSVYSELDVEICPIVTKGDRALEKPLAQIGDRGLFTKELERALLDDEIDIAVHSLKDLPTELPEGLILSSYSVREDPRDCLVSLKYGSLSELPKGAVVATGSVRRRSQLLNARPDLRVVDLRGNVETRLKKLESEDIDAILIAAAGSIRLGLKEKITEILSPDAFTPAVGQGIIAVESRVTREDLWELLLRINDSESEIMALAERAFLKELGGGCSVPVGATAEIRRDEIYIRGYMGSVDGKRAVRRSVSGNRSEAERVGEQLAKKILEV